VGTRLKEWEFGLQVMSLEFSLQAVVSEWNRSTG